MRSILAKNTNLIESADSAIEFEDSDIANNKIRSEQNEKDIAILSGRISNIESNETSINSRIKILEQSSINVTDGSIAQINANINNLDSEITALDNRVTTNEKKLINQNNSINNLTTQINTINQNNYATDIAKLKDDVTKI